MGPRRSRTRHRDPGDRSRLRCHHTRPHASRTGSPQCPRSRRGVRQETPGRLRGRVDVVHGDGTSMPFPDGGFDTVVCFTMLHHVPSPDQQDRLFAEARRVLRPGGVFAGCDGCASTAFRLLHLGDTYVPVPSETLPRRLRAAGFGPTEVTLGKGRFRFRAVRE
ncbi:class I SAM-dependent methyltransferase [Streptomyces sp. Ac-502]|uniref:class I SAM-dependent methyltransferase n=1 Tax=Streptomyces sp. Ac-502 TaxID=3342801 RepID=UPI0038624398